MEVVFGVGIFAVGAIEVWLFLGVGIACGLDKVEELFSVEEVA